MPTLAGQDALYLATSMKAYAQGQRDHTQMVTATAELSDAEIDALAAFYAEQEPIARKVSQSTDDRRVGRALRSMPRGWGQQLQPALSFVGEPERSLPRPSDRDLRERRPP